jgi:hypothetical protein
MIDAMPADERGILLCAIGDNPLLESTVIGLITDLAKQRDNPMAMTLLALFYAAGGEKTTLPKDCEMTTQWLERATTATPRWLNSPELRVERDVYISLVASPSGPMGKLCPNVAARYKLQ